VEQDEEPGLFDRRWREGRREWNANAEYVSLQAQFRSG
jgi:hypothetical protein